MKRRSFIKGTALGGVGISSFSNIQGVNKKVHINSEFYVTINEQKVSFYSDIINENLKIVHIADTHLFMDDERGIPFQEYSNRMAKAYNQTTHFKNRNITNPNECFENTLAFA